MGVRTKIRCSLAALAILMALPVVRGNAAAEEPGFINIHGHVVASTPRIELVGDGRTIRTHAVLKVDRAEDSSLVGSLIPVVADGGQVGDFRVWVQHMPEFAIGQEVRVRGRNLGGVFHASSGTPAAPFVTAEQALELARWDPAYATLYGFGWDCHRYLPGAYKHNLANAPSGARNAINAGFNSWEADGSSWMQFEDVGTTTINYFSSDGTNAVFWAGGDGTFLARTQVQQNGARITGFDVQFDRNFPFSANPSSTQIDIQSVAVHEAGHDIGLAHVPNCSQVMGVVLDSNGYNTCFAYGQLKRNLGNDDLAGLRALYPYGDFRGSVDSQSPNDSTIIMIPGQRYPTDLSPVRFQATFRNTGKTPWGRWQDRNYPVRVGTTLPDNRQSPFCDEADWLSCNRPDEYAGSAMICRNEVVTLSWYMQAPVNVDQYDEAFGAVIDGVAWLVKGNPRWSEIIAQG